LHPDWLKPVGKRGPPHTHLEKLDAHVISREEYEEDPEATDEEIASADLYHGAKLVRRGRPLKADRKVPMTIRLRPETLAHFKAKGPGWQRRIQDILNAVVSFETDQAEREAKTAADAVPAKKPARRKKAAAGGRGTRIQRYRG
jgi:uncharacterized protein (DUF4415 family)